MIGRKKDEWKMGEEILEEGMRRKVGGKFVRKNEEIQRK